MYNNNNNKAQSIFPKLSVTTLKSSKGLMLRLARADRARQRVRVCLLVVRSVQPVKPAGMAVMQSRSAAGCPAALLAILARTHAHAHMRAGPTCFAMHEEPTTSFVQTAGCRLLYIICGLHTRMVLKLMH